MLSSAQLALATAATCEPRLPAPAPRARAAECAGNRFRLDPLGAFSLQEAALFGFGQRHEDAFDGAMRLCFCLDGYEVAVGVVVTQAADGGELRSGAGPSSRVFLIRATGITDILPADEPRFLQALGALCELDSPSSEHAQRLARNWSPWRTWAAVLIRAAGPRLLGDFRAALSARSR